jgi:hypothetical protein
LIAPETDENIHHFSNTSHAINFALQLPSVHFRLKVYPSHQFCTGIGSVLHPFMEAMLGKSERVWTPPGGVGSWRHSTPAGGTVVGRGGHPSLEMLRGSGTLPTHESDSGAPRMCESISFCRCRQHEFDSGDVASFGQRSSFLQRRWWRWRHLYVGWGRAREGAAV